MTIYIYIYDAHVPVSRVTSIGIATVVNLRDRTNQLHKSIKMAAKLSVIKNKREKKNKQTQTTNKKKKRRKIIQILPHTHSHNYICFSKQHSIHIIDTYCHHDGRENITTTAMGVYFIILFVSNISYYHIHQYNITST